MKKKYHPVSVLSRVNPAHSEQLIPSMSLWVRRTSVPAVQFLDVLLDSPEHRPGDGVHRHPLARRKVTSSFSSARKYSPKAQRKVGRVMREYKHGTLKSGRARRPVRSRKQAVAIGLSEARRSGARVPPRRRRK
jgi:hypothetical protein